VAVPLGQPHSAVRSRSIPPDGTTDTPGERSDPPVPTAMVTPMMPKAAMASAGFGWRGEGERGRGQRSGGERGGDEG
jgi:hypothetical protein